MIREKVLLIALVVVVGLLLSSSNALAVPCQADADCNGEVGIGDLAIMKQEYFASGCDPSTKCGRCLWPCTQIPDGPCLFDPNLCLLNCLNEFPSNPFCIDFCMALNPVEADNYCFPKGENN